MAALRKRMPTIPYGDPLKFLDLVESPEGGLTLQDLQQAGPAYAFHFVMASNSKADHLDQELAQKIAKSEEEKAAMAEYEALIAREDHEESMYEMARAARAANPNMVVDENEDDEFHFPEGDAMDAEESIPAHLAHVNWHQGPAAHILKVPPGTNIGIALTRSQLPSSGRTPWITADEATELMWNKVDTITEIMEGLML